MEAKQKEFFDLLEEFRKLNVGSIMPGVPHGEACILKAVTEVCYRKEPDRKAARVSELVEELQVPPPAVSRGLRGLEERGLIRRRVDEKDRRNTFVELTDAGQQLHGEIEAAMTAFADAVFARVGADSFDVLNQRMRVLVDVSRDEIEKRKYKKGE